MAQDQDPMSEELGGDHLRANAAQAHPDTTDPRPEMTVEQAVDLVAEHDESEMMVADDLTLEAAQGLLSDPKKRIFIGKYAVHGNKSWAARETPISLNMVRYWIQRDAVFARAHDLAKAAAGDRLEEEAYRRAVSGIDQEIWHKGEVVGRKKVYSDTMLAMLLNGALPSKYVRRTQITGPGGGPLQVEPVVTRLTNKLKQIAATRKPSGGESAPD